MSFSGNLEHLPIVDVMQLLETTKKSGTLVLNDGSIVYKFGYENGYIVSVTHPDDRYSLAKLLEIKKIFDAETCANIYDECSKNKRVFSDFLIKEKKFSLQTLINLLTSFVELTVVDILTWEKGTFQLYVESVEISEEFKYISSIQSQKIYISTQNVLMESLRIYDEWRRDEVLKARVFTHRAVQSEAVSSTDLEITEDLLGLDNIEHLDRKIPNVFVPFKETDFINPHQKIVAQSFPHFTEEEQKSLSEFLITIERQKGVKTKSDIAIIYYGNDSFNSHAITSICKNMDIFVFTTDSEENIELIVNQSLSKSLTPVILVDGTEIELKNRYPSTKIIRITALENYESVFNYYEKGYIAVFPKPDKTSFTLTFNFFKSLYGYIKNLKIGSECVASSVIQKIELIKHAERVSDIAGYFAEFLNDAFTRYVVVIIQKDSFVVEKSKGFSLSNTLPLTNSRIITESINQSKVYFGNFDEEMIKIFYSNVERPSNKSVCIVPLSGLNKTLYLIYADNLSGNLCFQHVLLLQTFANTAINALLYRKLFEKNKRTV